MTKVNLCITKSQKIKKYKSILETEPDILKKLKSAEKEIAASRYKVWSKEKKSKRR